MLLGLADIPNETLSITLSLGDFNYSYPSPGTGSRRRALLQEQPPLDDPVVVPSFFNNATGLWETIPNCTFSDVEQQYICFLSPDFFAVHGLEIVFVNALLVNTAQQQGSNSTGETIPGRCESLTAVDKYSNTVHLEDACPGLVQTMYRPLGFRDDLRCPSLFCSLQPLQTNQNDSTEACILVWNRSICSNVTECCSNLHSSYEAGMRHIPTWRIEHGDARDQITDYSADVSVSTLSNTFGGTGSYVVAFSVGDTTPGVFPALPTNNRLSQVSVIVFQKSPILPINVTIREMSTATTQEACHQVHENTVHTVVYYDSRTSSWHSLPRWHGNRETSLHGDIWLTVIVPPEIVASNMPVLYLGIVQGISPTSSEEELHVIPSPGLFTYQSYAAFLNSMAPDTTGQQGCSVPVSLRSVEMQLLGLQGRSTVGAPTLLSFPEVPAQAVEVHLHMPKSMPPSADFINRRQWIDIGPDVQPSFYNNSVAEWQSLDSCRFEGGLDAFVCVLQPSFFIVNGLESMLANLVGSTSSVPGVLSIPTNPINLADGTDSCQSVVQMLQPLCPLLQGGVRVATSIRDYLGCHAAQCSIFPHFSSSGVIDGSCVFAWNSVCGVNSAGVDECCPSLPVSNNMSISELVHKWTNNTDNSIEIQILVGGSLLTVAPNTFDGIGSAVVLTYIPDAKTPYPVPPAGNMLPTIALIVQEAPWKPLRWRINGHMAAATYPIACTGDVVPTVVYFDALGSRWVSFAEQIYNNGDVEATIPVEVMVRSRLWIFLHVVMMPATTAATQWYIPQGGFSTQIPNDANFPDPNECPAYLPIREAPETMQLEQLGLVVVGSPTMKHWLTVPVDTVALHVQVPAAVADILPGLSALSRRRDAPVQHINNARIRTMSQKLRFTLGRLHLLNNIKELSERLRIQNKARDLYVSNETRKLPGKQIHRFMHPPIESRNLPKRLGFQSKVLRLLNNASSSSNPMQKNWTVEGNVRRLRVINSTRSEQKRGGPIRQQQQTLDRRTLRKLLQDRFDDLIQTHFFDSSTGIWQPLQNCTYVTEQQSVACFLHPSFFEEHGTSLMFANLASSSGPVASVLRSEELALEQLVTEHLRLLNETHMLSDTTTTSPMLQSSTTMPAQQAMPTTTTALHIQTTTPAPQAMPTTTISVPQVATTPAPPVDWGNCSQIMNIWGSACPEIAGATYVATSLRDFLQCPTAKCSVAGADSYGAVYVQPGNCVISWKRTCAVNSAGVDECCPSMNMPPNSLPLSDRMPNWISYVDNSQHRTITMDERIEISIASNTFVGMKSVVVITQGSDPGMGYPAPLASRASTFGILMQEAPSKPLLLYARINLETLTASVCGTGHRDSYVPTLLYHDSLNSRWVSFAAQLYANGTLNATIPPETVIRSKLWLFSSIVMMPVSSAQVYIPEGGSFAVKSPWQTPELNECVVPVPLELPAEAAQIASSGLTVIGSLAIKQWASVPNETVPLKMPVPSVAADALADSAQTGRRLLQQQAGDLLQVHFYNKATEKWQPLQNCTYDAALKAMQCPLQPQFFQVRTVSLNAIKYIQI